MNHNQTDALIRRLDGLLQLGRECEWIEFKENNYNPQEIGEYISAISNSAAIWDMPQGYVVWGIKDGTTEVVGTSFDPPTITIGNEELENWLTYQLAPRLNLRFSRFLYGEGPVVILEIDRAFRHPTRFRNDEFVRVGTYKKKLREHPEKEAALWRQFSQTPFEDLPTTTDLSPEEVANLLDIEAYFALQGAPYPEALDLRLEILKHDELIQPEVSGRWSISNLGAVLYARNLAAFRHLQRKMIRIIHYSGEDRIKALREWTVAKGYAAGFEEAVELVMEQLPSRETIESARRQALPMVPEVAVRELLANALIHQDFNVVGAGITVEIFLSRVEITNPGEPVVDAYRLLDLPPRSRNEAIASHMRRIGYCEERGSGIDRVVSLVEASQLPAPEFSVPPGSTKATLFGSRPLRDMDTDARNRACYWHACLKFVSQETLTNASLRQRFGIHERNSATVSRLIRDAIASGLIKPREEEAPNRLRRYVLFWA